MIMMMIMFVQQSVSGVCGNDDDDNDSDDNDDDNDNVFHSPFLVWVAMMTTVV